METCLKGIRRNWEMTLLAHDFCYSFPLGLKGGKKESQIEGGWVVDKMIR